MVKVLQRTFMLVTLARLATLVASESETSVEATACWKSTAIKISPWRFPKEKHSATSNGSQSGATNSPSTLEMSWFKGTWNFPDLKKLKDWLESTLFIPITLSL